MKRSLALLALAGCSWFDCAEWTSNDPEPVRASGATVSIPSADLEDRIRGGLLGQIFGNLNGLPHEFKYIDQPGKVEVAADLIRRSRFIADDARLALAMGALAGAGLGRESLHAELGEVLAGHTPGRTTNDEITVFGSVGLPFQDLVAAWLVYQAARTAHAGHEVSLLD